VGTSKIQQNVNVVLETQNILLSLVILKIHNIQLTTKKFIFKVRHSAISNMDSILKHSVITKQQIAE